jgi:hypothetical protein
VINMSNECVSWNKIFVPFFQIHNCNDGKTTKTTIKENIFTEKKAMNVLAFYATDSYTGQ